MTAPLHHMIGIMGGTFNPIHHGHLRMAQELADALHLDEVRFIPSANPPHKNTPQVSASQRAAMVQMAIADNPTFKLDERELKRDGPSYTFDTLQSLRAELGNDVSICLLMGSDAFVKLNTWHRWDELLNLCHIVSVVRTIKTSQEALAPALQALLHQHYTEHIDDLTHSAKGHITMQEVTQLDISATTIRQQLQAKQSVRYITPNSVIEYINTQHLYG